MLNEKKRVIKSSQLWSTTITLLVLITSGIGYRLVASEFHRIVDQPIPLPVPLNNFPTQIENWAGQNLEIPATTQNYMRENFADDFLSRRYINEETKNWFDIYVVFCSSKPSGILGHRPRVCYRAHGWNHDDTSPSEVTTSQGTKIPCLIHRFHKSLPSYEEIVVLNYYIVNGQITIDESTFSSIWGRRPNISGDMAHYVTQVQISSTRESSVRIASREFSDLILNFLPNTKNIESSMAAR